MSKEEFLRELERKLHVLNEQERRDVLEDYAQHIDLKIKNGQSEEEAVRSLGDPGELAAEMLDVYHINSEYASEPFVSEDAGEASRDDKNCVTGSVEKKEGFLGSLRKRIAKRSAAGKERRKAARAQKAEKEKGSFRKLPEQIAGTFAAGKEERKAVRAQKKEERRAKREAKKEMRKGKKRMNRESPGYRSAGSVLSSLLARCAALIGTCVRFFWKAVLFMTALPVMCFGAFGLFLGGALLVLLLRGYPLAGVGIVTAGLTMSSFGITALILSWVFTGKKSGQAGAEISGAGVSGTAGDFAEGTNPPPEQTTQDAVKKTASKEERTVCSREQESAGAGDVKETPQEPAKETPDELQDQQEV